MDSFISMKNQVNKKLKDGFQCIKLKIGAIDFNEEIRLLKLIRKEFSENDMKSELMQMVPFSPDDALEKIKRLSDFKLHSIEQPIKSGQHNEMAKLCLKTPLPNCP